MNLNCDKCNEHTDSQAESFNCKGIFKNEKPGVEYEDVFGEEIPFQLIKTLEKITSARQD